jgi:hypothetical protein
MYYITHIHKTFNRISCVKTNIGEEFFIHQVIELINNGIIWYALFPTGEKKQIKVAIKDGNLNNLPEY